MTETGPNQPRLAPKRGDEDFAVFRDEGIYYADKKIGRASCREIV